MKLRLLMVAAAIAAVVSCEEATPTGVGGDLNPVRVRTVELHVPWEAFAANLRVYGGFGSTQELGTGVLANGFREGLESRTLVRYGNLSVLAAVRDTTGTQRGDSTFVFTGGDLVVVFDTLSSTNVEPITVEAHRTVQDWHAPTASWEVAIDTANDRSTWEVPGGGDDLIDGGLWDPATGDTLVLAVDSATLAAWSDTTDFSRGVRLQVIDPGVRIEVLTARLRYRAIPSSNPDTVITLTQTPSELTFIYAPVPEAPVDGIRVGGAPAWRTVIDVTIPETLEGPPDFCAAFGCPFRVESSNVSLASLVLSTRNSSPAAFQPTDTVRLDVRAVLSPERLPKAALGSSFVGGAGRAVAPGDFAPDTTVRVAVPITSFVRALLQGETDGGEEAPSSLALLSAFEPLSISFASFYGPGTVNAPYLRLVITKADTVKLP